MPAESCGEIKASEQGMAVSGRYWLEPQETKMKSKNFLVTFSSKLSEVYVTSYITASLFSHLMEAVMFIIPQYFSTCGKIIYEQLTVYGVGGLLFSVL